jgi:hypothetical protein
MQVRAKDTLFIRDRKLADGTPAEYVQPGEMAEVDDAKAQLWIDRGHAEAVTAKEAAKAAKEQGG